MKRGKLRLRILVSSLSLWGSPCIEGLFLIHGTFGSSLVSVTLRQRDGKALSGYFNSNNNNHNLLIMPLCCHTLSIATNCPPCSGQTVLCYLVGVFWQLPGQIETLFLSLSTSICFSLCCYTFDFHLSFTLSSLRNIPCSRGLWTPRRSLNFISPFTFQFT